MESRYEPEEYRHGHHNQPMRQMQRHHQGQGEYQQTQQHQQLQQVSTLSDHQLVISAGSNDLMFENQLAYNYEDHEDVCSEAWNIGSSNPENCVPLSHQQNDQTYGSDQSIYRLNMTTSSMTSSVRNQPDQISPNSGYTQISGSDMQQKISLKLNNDDFNNNQHHQQLQQQQQQHHQHQHHQQQQRHNSTFSQLGSMLTNRALDQIQSSYCHSNSTNNQEQLYYYTNTLCDDSSSYQHPYHLDSYNGHLNNPQSNHTGPYDVISLDAHNQSQNHSHHSAPTQSGRQQSPTSSSINHQQPNIPSYEQVHHSPNLTQCNQQELGCLQKRSMDDSFRNHHNNHHQAQLFQPAQDHHAQEYKEPAYDPLNQQQQSMNQNPGSDTQYVLKSSYTNLQHMALNCDNFTNQVSTTTMTTDDQNQSVNKNRSLKGRRGRPRKKGLRSKNKVNGKLWEFIRDLLLNERTNPSFIRWERREDGVFKFVQSDKVAKMWGERKQNPKMTYEKLSRAMRYYYKNKVLLPVFGRRLVYKFGPNATGWLPVSNSTGF